MTPLEYGTVKALNTAIRYDQEKRIIERFLKDLKDSGQTKFYLESCNTNALCCGIEAVDGKFLYELPTKGGKQLYGQADFAFFYLYSTYAQHVAPVVKDGIAENEIMENLTWLVPEISDCKAIQRNPRNTKELILMMDFALEKKRAIVLSYLTDYGSGHYITVVHRNLAKKTFYSYDSWEKNKHCRFGGVLEEYQDEFFTNRCKERLRFIEIYKE